MNASELAALRDRVTRAKLGLRPGVCPVHEKCVGVDGRCAKCVRLADAGVRWLEARMLERAA